MYKAKDYGESESISSNSLGKLKISGHDSDSLGVDGAKIGVFEEGDEVSLGSFLEGKNSRALESKLLLELMGDFSHESLEGEFSDEEISGFLVFSDFSEGNCSGFESVGLLDSSGNWGRFTGNLLGDQLFSGHLLCC
jgi:histone H3